jgi:hypothetical protein
VTSKQRLKKRLLHDETENRHSEMTVFLTNLSLYKPLATQYGPQPFALCVMEQFTILEACRHTTYFEEEIGDEVLLSQIRKFFVRLHPFLEIENLNIRSIFKQFLTKPELFDSIPDLLQCIATSFLIGHNESYIESLGSVLKHHNPPQRNLSLQHLDMEVSIAWNGPKVAHADELIKETLTRMYGPGQWHFFRSSEGNRLKFFKVSKAVDKLQNQPASVFHS